MSKEIQVGFSQRIQLDWLLNGFGVNKIMTASGEANGRLAWLIRFEWRERSYRFAFTPLPCQNPQKVTTFAGKKRSHLEQAEWQMGRIAAHFTKAILTAAEAHPYALFGFMELPNPNGQGAQTAGDLGIEGVLSALPSMRLLLNG